mmetsp:Transcript_15708/g.61353  ORF Transcript_15708/g.61353 Transcript_15708/m.61353 type:complete len:340 (+) Transcript_15708:864-1883(+)
MLRRTYLFSSTGWSLKREMVWSRSRFTRRTCRTFSASSRSSRNCNSDSSLRSAITSSLSISSCSTNRSISASKAETSAPSSVLCLESTDRWRESCFLSFSRFSFLCSSALICSVSLVCSSPGRHVSPNVAPLRSTTMLPILAVPFATSLLLASFSASASRTSSSISASRWRFSRSSSAAERAAAGTGSGCACFCTCSSISCFTTFSLAESSSSRFASVRSRAARAAAASSAAFVFTALELRVRAPGSDPLDDDFPGDRPTSVSVVCFFGLENVLDESPPSPFGDAFTFLRGGIEGEALPSVFCCFMRRACLLRICWAVRSMPAHCATCSHWLPNLRQPS